MASLLDSIHDPADVRRLPASRLAELASDLRAEMIAATALNGGHLASSLGAVELILAAYRVLDMPHDKLLFDVGHQAYAHKLMTGRRAGFVHLRQASGTSGFTRRKESVYDAHDSGHASDALATAAGLALARDLSGDDARVVSIVGDASLAGFLAALRRGWKPENALRFAAACGAAAVFSPGGMGSRAEAERLYALTALAGPAVRRLPAP